jgi:hypothetical protein
MLESTPVARPVIFTLAGCAAGERCVIERTEDGHLTRTEQTSAANDWLAPRNAWEARVGGDQLFTASPSEVGGNSWVRREALAAWSAPFGAANFGWVVPPVLNPFTRIAAEMCSAQGVLRVVGYEKLPQEPLPQAVTGLCEIAAPAARVAALV